MNDPAKRMGSPRDISNLIHGEALCLQAPESQGSSQNHDAGNLERSAGSGLDGGVHQCTIRE
jgi:hypothetical protein